MGGELGDNSAYRHTDTTHTHTPHTHTHTHHTHHTHSLYDTVLSCSAIRLSFGSCELYEQKIFLMNRLFWSSVSYFLRLHEWKSSEHFSAFRSFPKNKSHQHNVMFISSSKHSHLLVASRGRDHVGLHVHTHYVDRMTVNNIENTEVLHRVTCDDARMWRRASWNWKLDNLSLRWEAEGLLALCAVALREIILARGGRKESNVSAWFGTVGVEGWLR